MYVCMYVWESDLAVCMYVRTHVFMYVCMYARTYVRTCVPCARFRKKQSRRQRA